MVRGKDAEGGEHLELRLGTGSPVNLGELTVDRNRVLIEEQDRPDMGINEIEEIRREMREMRENFARSQEEARIREQEAGIENATLSAALERKRQQNETLERALARSEAEISGGSKRKEPVMFPHMEEGMATGRRAININTELFPNSDDREISPVLPYRAEEREGEMELSPTQQMLQTLTATVEEMKDKIDRKEKSLSRPARSARFKERAGPFSRWISQSVRGGSQKSLKLTYLGKGCPLQHLDSFRSQTAARGYSDAVCCNMFQETLAGEALSWFYELSPGSIETFDQLADELYNRFILRVEGEQDSAGLFNCRQAEGEDLKTFINRWQVATAGVRNLDKSIAEQAFKQGLKSGKFLYTVRVERPQGYERLMAMAVRHAQAEEETYGGHRQKRKGTEPVAMIKDQSTAQQNSQTVSTPSKRTNNNWQGQGQNQNYREQGQGGQAQGRGCGSQGRGAGGQSQSRSYGNQSTGYGQNNNRWSNQGQRGNQRGSQAYSQQSESPNPAAEVFTTLTSPYGKILEENRDIIPNTPPRRRPKSNLTQEDTGKYCIYHDEATHHTNNCLNLKRAVEALLKEGKLQQYTEGARNVSTIATGSQHRINIYGNINTIHGGERKDQLTRQAKKRCLRSMKGREVYAFEARGDRADKTGWKSITFREDEEPEELIQPHDDPFIITVQIDHYITGRMLIDTGASVNVMFRDAYKSLNRGKNKLTQDNEPLISFSGEVVQPLGSDYLPLIFREGEKTRDIHLEFIVVDCLSAYNSIIGQPGLWRLKTFIAGHMLMMKMPSPTGIITIRGDQRTARKSYSDTVTAGRVRAEVFTAGSNPAASHPIVDPRDDTDSEDDQPTTTRPDELKEFKKKKKEKPEAAEETEQISVWEDHPDRKLVIGTRMGAECRADLISCLRENRKVFAWSYEDMPGISPDIAVHSLNIVPGSEPVRQRRRSFNPAKYEAIRREVEKLRSMDYIREVRYPRWLANVVMVPKKETDQWRMCVDYTNLNRACPKDSFPLPRIDQLVDSTSGFKMLSFMDAYAGYNQIGMDPEDEEHTAFTTDRGLYCYKRMPYGLKNVGATFQRVVNRMLENEIGKKVEVYVDDMLVKSPTTGEHTHDLSSVIGKMLRYGMRLNPKKCIFGISEGKFLGHIISQRGIEANPDKVKAVINMQSPRERNQVSILTGRLNALARFISRLTDKCAPFFNLLKSQRCREIAWGEEQEAAFQAIKSYLASVPLLLKPVTGEMLYLYLAVSLSAVSSALIRKEGTLELPVYYVGKGYTGAESRYPDIEKLALALVVSARKLRHYFQAHSITVFTNHPLRQIMQKPETSGRLVRWAVELGEFDITFAPRTAIKGQAAADFISELTPMESRAEHLAVSLGEDRAAGSHEENKPSGWKLFVDGSVTQKRSGAGIILTSPTGHKYEYALRFLFNASNNEAEYEALVSGLQLAKEMDLPSVEVFSDSKLVVNQINGQYEAKEPAMSSYLALTKALMMQFKSATIQHIPRVQNVLADTLAKLATGSYTFPSSTAKLETLQKPSISRTVSELFAIDEAPPSWMDPIKKFLVDGILPEDKMEARKLKIRCARYSILNEKLYRRGYCYPHLLCVTEDQGKLIMKEIHEGVCGNHSGARTLTYKFLRSGYFWSGMAECSRLISGKCHKCHMYQHSIQAPAIALSILIAPRPFAQWGMDLIGSFPTAKGQFKHAIVIVDYETKWVEAAPLVKITEEVVQSFLWKNLFCRFGVPEVIITDNGTQFNNDKLIQWTERQGTRMVFASVAHPKINGQVEAVNKIIKNLLKKKLDEKKGLWAETLPAVLWGIRTTASEATGETPFALTFGTEAVLPVEMKVPTGRVENYDASTNGEGLNLNLDLIEDLRDRARMHNQVYKQRVARYYARRVRERTLKVGDWVMKKFQRKVPALQPTWEGPFQITDQVGPVTFHIRSQDDVKSTHPWNIEHLRYYPI